MSLEMLSSYTCFHDANTERLGIVERHREIFGINHEIVTIGRPEDKKVFEIIMNSRLHTCSFQKHFDFNRETLMQNALMAHHCPQPHAPEISQIDINVMARAIIANPSLALGWMSPRVLRAAEVSLALKHKYAISSFLAKTSNEYCIVLEDDAIVHDKTVEVLELLLKHVAQVCSDDHSLCVDLSDGCNIEIALLRDEPVFKINDYHLYRPLRPSVKTTCAYLLNRNMAAQFMKHYGQSYCAPIDFELTFALGALHSDDRNSFNNVCLWIEPPVFVHGSEALLDSSIGH